MNTLPHETIQPATQSPNQPISQLPNQTINRSVHRSRSNHRRYLAFILMSISVALIAWLIASSFHQSTSESDGSCPYADVLGLQSNNQTNKQSINQSHKPSMPPHVLPPGLSEADCPHLARQRQSNQPKQSISESFESDESIDELINQRAEHIEVAPVDEID